MARWSRATVGSVVLDVAAIVAVAGLLVGIHTLVPAGVRDGLALRFASPDPLHAFTAAYVHLDDAHLTGNLVGYLAGAGLGYVLALAADERRWFRFSFAWFLTVLPVAVGLSSAFLIDRAAVGRGFSGVVAGFAGLVLVATVPVLHRGLGYDRRLAWDVVAAMVMVLAAEILWVVAGVVRPLVGGLLVVGGALSLVPIGRAGRRAGWPAGREGWRRLAGAVVVSVLIFAAVSWFVVGLFPAQLVSDGGVTNVLGHYLGLVYGAVIAGWGYRYWSTR